MQSINRNTNGKRVEDNKPVSFRCPMGTGKLTEPQSQLFAYPGCWSYDPGPPKRKKKPTNKQYKPASFRNANAPQAPQAVDDDSDNIPNVETQHRLSIYVQLGIRLGL